MDQPSLEYFVEIARKLNISKAAESLHISQQSLSAYVQKLEKHYGTALFTRKPKLKLTEAGERVLLAAEEIERIHQELEEDLLRLGAVEETRLSLAIFEPTISPVMHHLPVVEIGKKYPNVAFSITTGYNQTVLSLIQEGRADLAVIGSSDVDPKLLEDMEQVELSHDEDCILITEDVMRLYFVDEYDKYVERFSEGVDLLDLAHIPIAMHPMESGISKKIRNYFMENHQSFKVFGEGSTQDIVNSMVLQNNAYGVCSRSAAEALLSKTSAKRLHIFPLERPRLERHLALLYRKNDSRREALADIAAMFEAKWKGLPKPPQLDLED
ncbi:MAG: LysR family transcriptional regulator [Lachnospiraceae bacterium]|nr:LysR family transcriptional regulator [Lachnospiraceae bacterium]